MATIHMHPASRPLAEGLARLARLFPEVVEFRARAARRVEIDIACEDAKLSAHGGSVASALQDAELVLKKYRSTRTKMSGAEMRELADEALRLAKERREEGERAIRRKPPVPPPFYGA